MSDKGLEEIRARAEQVDKHACDLASGAKEWRMSIPPQDDDSDMLIVKLAREDVPYLLSLVAEAREALEFYAETHVWCLATMHVKNGEKGFELYERFGQRARAALAKLS